MDTTQPKNISSNELDEQEVTRFAEQLKKEMHNTPTDLSEEADVASSDMLKKEIISEDTIVIDQDGNMMRSNSQPATTSESRDV
jgi:hypothetical protein